MVKSKLITMLKVDFRRMFTTKLFYIMMGISFVAPILILVMTTMMDGTVNVDPTTGAETVIEGFDYVWQIIATPSGAGSETMSMDLISMCNINMFYFAIAVLVCIFVSDDFRSGYAKNLFTTRAKKNDYVISKSLVLFIGGALMIIAFIIGSLLGGAISSLSFELVGATSSELVMCILSKILLVAVFTPIFLVMSVVGKQRLRLSLVCALGASMLLFTMVPMITPLNSTIMNVVLCLAGGILFSVGIGYISNLILNRKSIL